MSLPVQDAAYPTPDEIRDTMLRAVRYAYLRLGIDRNVLPGSDDYIRIDKLAGRVGIAIANNEIAAENSDPLTATSQPLIDLAALFGVFPRPAAGAAGNVNATFAGALITIPANFTGTVPSGKKYLAAAGSYTTGTPIPVSAVSAGADTNQTASTILTWDSASIGALAPTATVATGGLTGGSNTDDEETLRQRLLRKLAAAAVGGNWSSVVGWAEESTASVATAYCYPAAQGPGSYDVAVLAAGGDRTLPAAIVAQVRAYILARMPGQNQLTCTTVTPAGVDISLQTKLPLPDTAGGVGGGWRDPIPWPQEDCKITGWSSGTATVNSTTAPAAGNSIGIWDPTYQDPVTGLVVGIMREYTVAAGVGGGAGAWTFTATPALPSTVNGQYVSAGAVSLVPYARAFADAMAVLGPGQKTALPELLPRAQREPPTDLQAPSDLTSRLLDAVQTPFGEIADLQWGVRYATGTTSPLTSPPIPTSTADPPRVLVLSSIAFRRE